MLPLLKLSLLMFHECSYMPLVTLFLFCLCNLLCYEFVQDRSLLLPIVAMVLCVIGNSEF